jgi:hypothetical protein
MFVPGLIAWQFAESANRAPVRRQAQQSAQRAELADTRVACDTNRR